ncbi:OadG family protein [Rhabdochromatium marinum]|uniref:OadG family protein n=1 Tax=Rhabdochromatium marinum TaxID=48729 RepID=UPI001F5B663A|nr:OadG family protein [Rhabdochromatium marinum]
MIGESLWLMLIGMSIVFAFLMLLVVLLRGMSWFAARVAPVERLDSSAAALPSGGAVAQTDVIAVITAAVAHYRARH